MLQERAFICNLSTNAIRRQRQNIIPNYSKSVQSLCRDRHSSSMHLFLPVFLKTNRHYLPGIGAQSMDPEGPQTLKAKISKIKMLQMFYVSLLADQEYRSVQIYYLVFIHTTGYFSV